MYQANFVDISPAFKEGRLTVAAVSDLLYRLQTESVSMHHNLTEDLTSGISTHGLYIGDNVTRVERKIVLTKGRAYVYLVVPDMYLHYYARLEIVGRDDTADMAYPILFESRRGSFNCIAQAETILFVLNSPTESELTVRLTLCEAPAS